MISAIKHGTAVALLGVAATLTGSMPSGAAVAASPQTAVAGWRVYATIAQRGHSIFLGNIDPVAPGDTWMSGVVEDASGLGQRALLEHWNGSSWLRVALPARGAALLGGQVAVVFAGATAGNDVWVFDQSGRYLRLSGKTWIAGTIAPARNPNISLDQAAVFGPSDVWVFGLRFIGPASRLDFRPYAARFNGRTWATVAVPGTGAISVSAVSARDMWAVSGTTIPGAGIPSRPRILRWNGRAWRAVGFQPRLPKGATLASILAESPENVWIGGSRPNGKAGQSELAQRWNGKSWFTVNPPARASGDDFYLAQIVRDGAGGLWAVSSNLGASDPGPDHIWHYARGAWSAPASVFSKWVFPALAWVPHTRSVWGTAGSPGLVKGLIILHGPVPR